MPDTWASRSARRRASGDPQACGPRGVGRAWKGKVPGNRVNPLPKVQQQWPHLPRRRASSRGDSLAGGTGALPLGSLGDLGRCWHRAPARCGVGAGLKEASGSVHRTLGPRNTGTLTPGSRGGTLPWWGAWGRLFSLHPEPYVSFSRETGSRVCQVQHRVVPALFQHTRPGLNPRARRFLASGTLALPAGLSPPFLPPVSPSKLPRSSLLGLSQGVFRPHPLTLHTAQLVPSSLLLAPCPTASQPSLPHCWGRPRFLCFGRSSWAPPGRLLGATEALCFLEGRAPRSPEAAGWASQQHWPHSSVPGAPSALACFPPPSFLFSSSFLFLPCVTPFSLLHHCLHLFATHS